MARCRQFWGWWQVAAAVVLIATAGSADAGRTSGRTGKGATHDNSVYCQNSPGQPARPAYRGTGSQNPFGGECGPGPRQEEQPEAEDGDSCPLQQASLRPAGVILVANQQEAQPRIVGDGDRQPGLWIAAGGGEWQEVLSPDQVGLDDLTLLGKAILKEMRCHQTRMFRFTGAQRLKDTIRMRVAIVKLMEDRVHNLQIAFGGCIAAPPQWETYRDGSATLGYAAKSRPGVSAHDAVEGFRAGGSRLDCHAGSQLTVLDAADQVLGPERFNALHAGDPSLFGLGVPLLGIKIEELRGVPLKVELHPNDAGASLADHLRVVRFHVPWGEQNQHSADGLIEDPRARPIQVADMVLGDWAFITNVPAYRRVAPRGANAGENVLYVGELTAGEPRTRVFFGIGIEQLSLPDPPRFQSESDLQKHLAKVFNALQWNPFGGRAFDAKPADMVWTRLGGPTLDKQYPDEAGPFVR